ncbi:MAG: response regulator transcription factor [Actinomycetota bacterium]|nr:response regulator transcription factor [Actinomycetota bacterium]
MASVLIVDDEANIRELVSVYMTAAGYEVFTAQDGNAALVAFRDHLPDLVVLDIMIPGLDGAEVCAAIRAESSTPIIMLTARESELDKVALLERGADDYVTKPFSPAELVARVRAVLRRTAEPVYGGSANEVREAAIQVGELLLDPATREVSVGDSAVDLTAREFNLLAAMASEPGVVFSRESLLDRAWGFNEYVEARGVDVHIRHIREKLGDGVAAPRFIETVRGVGYRVRRDNS